MDSLIIILLSLACGVVGGWVVSDYWKNKRVTRWKVAIALGIVVLACFVVFTPGPPHMFLDYWFK